MKGVGLLIGIGFGFVLGWSRLTDPDVIRAMLLLRRYDVFLMMGAAIATAALLARVLRAAQVKSMLDGTPIAWSVTRPRRHHVLGSLLFGIGWAVSGTCPGPVAAQLGRGQLAALFTLAGIFFGVALFGALKRRREREDLVARSPEPAGAGPGL